MLQRSLYASLAQLLMWIGVEFGVNAEGNGYETVEAETMDLVYHTGYKQIYLQIVQRSIKTRYSNVRDVL